MRAATFALLTAAGVVAGAASAAAQGQSAPEGFERTSWRLMSLEGLEPAALDAAPRAIIRFDSGRVDGFAGCNQARGSYTIEGDHVTLGPLTVTLKKCAAPAMRLEEALKGSFAGSPRAVVADGRLTLSSRSGPIMVFEAEPAEPLEGGEWEITALTDGRGGMAPPVAGARLSFEFRGDGAVAGNAGCNLFKADYARDSDRLALAPPVATRKSCPGAGVMEQEQSFLALLEKVKSWTLRDHQLELRLAGGETALTARRPTL